MLQINELKSRAAAFAANHADDRDEQRDKQTFWNNFFAIFGIDRRRYVIYEKAVEKITGDRGFIDAFWPGTLIVEQKSLRGDLFKAKLQALDYLHGLRPEELPRYRIVSDFRSFILTDFDTGEDSEFLLRDLPRHIHKFDFMLGRKPVRFRDQDPANIRAAELVGHLHDALKSSGYTGHRLEVFLTRIVFCLFADDTGIFEPKDLLLTWLDGIASPESIGPALAQLFDTLNTAVADRQSTLPPELARFPHVNGALFAEYFPPPAFDDAMRTALLNACRFDWTPISPAIFGSLFQSVMNPDERRRLGAHYTTEKNILKLIGPLFMDDLRAEFAAARARKTGRNAALAALHDRLARMTFLDPACGCGNFLVIAYRELRLLEIELLKEMRTSGQLEFEARNLSRIDVDQFYGIEIEEFPARIAEIALWMVDHLMNLRLSEAFGGYYPRIPLKKSPHIVHADALAVDWATVLPPDRCSFVLGNPPFVGAKFQSDEQRAQVRRIAALGKSGGTLDFVAAWFLKAGEYVRRSGFTPTHAPRIAFVSTNSITQGEQVAQLWPLLFNRYGLEIAFAHRTFEWESEARGKAHVHAVILGLDLKEHARPDRRLYSYDSVKGDPTETVHKALSPYLFDAGNLTNPHMVVERSAKKLNSLPEMRFGTQPIDGGHLIFDDEGRKAFLAVEPDAEVLFRPFVGSFEYINGVSRWILAVQGVDPTFLRRLPEVRKRIALVREFRLSSKRPVTVQLADYPTQFAFSTIPSGSFLVTPEVSSERRPYVPIGWLSSPTIPSNLVRATEAATLSDFAILTSAMHMAWLRYIGGRLKSDYRYSIGLVYNTFPLPPGKDLTPLAPLGQTVLDARAAHPGATLATLYDPDLMPPNLRRAHQALDRAVDRLYRPQGFASDRERVEHLFTLYESLATPLLKTPRRKPR